MADPKALTTSVKGPSGFGLAASPESIDQARAMCEAFARTDFVPKAFRGKPDAILVVGAMGARIGVDVFTAMSGIADINGRPCIYGDLMLAVVLNHPECEDVLEAFEGKPYDDNFRAVCTVRRKGKAPKVGTFSVIEAKEAGLWGKAGPWKTTPQRMLQMRARAFALRDSFADALAGFHSREEMEDTQEAEVLSVRSEPAPARTGQQFEQPATDSVPPPVQPTTPPPPAAPHPAIATCRELYRTAEKLLKGTGHKITTRACKLHGADDPKSVPVDRLDAFGKTVETLQAAAGDYDKLMETISRLEVDAAEAEREEAATGGTN